MNYEVPWGPEVGFVYLCFSLFIFHLLAKYIVMESTAMLILVDCMCLYIYGSFLGWLSYNYSLAGLLWTFCSLMQIQLRRWSYVLPNTDTSLTEPTNKPSQDFHSTSFTHVLLVWYWEPRSTVWVHGHYWLCLYARGQNMQRSGGF